VLVALAPQPAYGEPRITIGRATEFYADRFPDTDYLFYCYGSSILVSRRLNQADLSLNLGALMPKLGGPGDGGHAAAAVCRPEANAEYPVELLGSVDGPSFGRFVSYLGHRMRGLGYPLDSARNLSHPAKTPPRGGRGKLIWVTLAAAAVGILLCLLHPAFRRRAVQESNERFFPHITAADMPLEEEESP
jgi:hypothetical protein